MTAMVPVRPANSLAMPRVTTHSAVATMGSGSPGITPSVTTSSLLHKLQHLVRCGRDASSSLGLTEGQLMFFSQAGLMDLTVPWM